MYFHDFDSAQAPWLVRSIWISSWRGVKASDTYLTNITQYGVFVLGGVQAGAQFIGSVPQLGFKFFKEFLFMRVHADIRYQSRCEAVQLQRQCFM